MDWRFGSWLKKIEAAFKDGPQDAAGPEIRDASLRIAPVIWLLGKTGSGKTSIIAALTGREDALIGGGFAPCTKTATRYDFPPDAPVLRFLDTRGIGEAGYEPTEDMAVNEDQAHLVIATMRVSDMDQGELLRALHQIRARHRNWPIIIVQTALHERYSGTDTSHPDPMPDFAADGELHRSYHELRSAVRHQRSLLRGLSGAAPSWVTIDFTRPDDGYEPALYGRVALIDTIVDVAPAALAELARLELMATSREGVEAINAKTFRIVLYYAAAAAGSGALPVVGAVTSPAVAAAMLWALSREYGEDLNSNSIASLIGALGTSVIVREGAKLALRQVGKLAPFLIPLFAAQDYVATFALGYAARLWMHARQFEPEMEEEELRKRVRKAFEEGAREAIRSRGAEKSA
jgi:hypothetical protein